MSPTQVCKLCSVLEIDEALRELFGTVKGSQLTGVGAQQESAQKPWHLHLPAVLESSASCVLCKLVLQGLRESREQLVEDTRFSGDWAETPEDFDDDILTIPYYSNGKLNLRIIVWPVDNFEVENTMSSIHGSESKLKTRAIIRVACDGGNRASWDGYGPICCELRISSRNGQVRDYVQIDRSTQQDPTSIEVFDQLKAWLSVCDSSHKKCNKDPSYSSALPTRVLNIDPLDLVTVRLEQPDKSAERGQPYAALSHCWGTSQPFITTTETLEERKRGILISALPQSYQDAITVTRALGLQYIWIDSLCITQNDKQDWQREAGKMASVYRDAHIVIGASNANADSEGFLHPRTTGVELYSEDFHISLLPPEAQRLSAASEPVMGEPLNARAWTLQERYLPHRMISYGKTQVYWECSEMIASEDGDCMPRDGDRLRLVTKTAAIDKSICGISGRSPGDIKDVNYFDWYETVKEYARRRITKPADRLPALSGLAKAISEVTGDEYLAGIWKKGLIEGLLWCRAEKDHSLTEPEYRAPSWSWVSVDGFINFTVYNFYDRCVWKYMMANFEFTATYVDSFLEPIGEDRYGGIKHGWIRLKAPLFPITSVKNWDDVSYRPPGIMTDPVRSSVCNKVFEAEIQHKGKREKLWLDGCLDLSETTNTHGNLFVLFLARLPDPGSSSGVYLDIRFGLILEALGSKEKFKRVGIIDGTVKIHKTNITAKLKGKLYLEPLLLKVQQLEEEEETPNLLGPDPYDRFEQTIVTIV